MTRERPSRAVFYRFGVLLATLLAVGLPGDSRAQRYPSRVYTESDGLPSADVRGILQDDKGQVWVATRAGAARYDGFEWATYPSVSALRSQDLAGIRTDSRGRIWTASSVLPLRLGWLEGDTWQALPSIVTESDGISLLDFAVVVRGEWTSILAETTDGQLHVWDGAQWTRPQIERRSMGLFHYVIEPVEGRFLVGSADGLEVLDPGRPDEGLVTMTDAPSGEILGIDFDPATGHVWLIGTDWIGRLEDGRIVRLASNLNFDFISRNRTAVVTHDRFGGIYFGNKFGVYYFHPRDGLSEFGPENGLVSPGTTGILVDREDNIWFAGMRGVSKITSRRFAGYDASHGLFADEVSAVLETQRGEIVLGHRGGLTFFDAGRRTLKIADELFGRVLDLAETGDGTLWSATGWAGLVEIRADGEIRRHREWESNRSVVWTVLVDRADRLWVGVNDHLYTGRPGAFERVGLPFPPVAGDPQALRGMIRRLFEGANGELYVATGDRGLFVLRDGQAVQATHPTLPLANRIYSVLETADAGVLVGSGAGLMRYEAGRLEAVDSPSIERPVYFIVADAERRFWFGTDAGAVRWDGQNVDRFTVRSDLIGAETNRAAGVLDSKGRLWIGTDRGVSIYRSAWDQPRPSAPTVELLELESGGEVLAAVDDRRLPPDHGGLSFRFRAISFIDEERVRFRYRLDPLERDWVGPREIARREIHYARLPAGTYHLHLQAIDVEGRTSAEIVSSRIVVARPLWSRPWFVGVEVLFAVALIYGLISYSTQHRYARQLELDVRKRTRELLESERSSAQERERLSVTLSNIVDGVATTDRSGKVVLWNPGAERITGRSAEEMLGRVGEEVLREMLPFDLAEGQDVGFDLRREFPGDKFTIIAGDGKPRILQVSSARIRSGNELAGFVYAFRDTTESDRMQEDLDKARRLESLGLLAGGIAHDFNNLLATVVSSVSLIELADGLDDQDRDNLRVVRSAALKAAALTNQLLTFAKGGAPTRRPVSIRELVTEATTFALRGGTVSYTLDLAPELQAVNVDDAQMGQVIQNLVLNARQAMPNGGTIHVRGRNLGGGPAALPEGRYVLIEVEDHGEGIPEADLERVFDPYFSTKKDGVGLGLATAYSIVNRHEGRIAVESTEGGGSTFRIWLPASDSRADRRPPEPAVETGCQGKILVMDDQTSFRRMVVQILERQGYVVQSAGDGREAIEAFLAEREDGGAFDLLILDLTVPGGMGGVETLAEIRKLDSSQRAIAMSGYSNDPVLAQPDEFGFQGGLGKPFELHEFLAVVGRALNEEPGRSV